VASESTAPAGGYRGILVTAALATMLAPLNSTMIAVALPQVMGDLGSGVAATGWLSRRRRGAWLSAWTCW